MERQKSNTRRAIETLQQKFDNAPYDCGFYLTYIQAVQRSQQTPAAAVREILIRTTELHIKTRQESHGMSCPVTIARSRATKKRRG